MSQDRRHDAPALEELTTEAAAPELADIDALDTQARLELINQADAKVAAAVGLEIPQIARAVHRAAHSFRAGGRLDLCRRGHERPAGRPGRRRVPADLRRPARLGAGPHCGRARGHVPGRGGRGGRPRSGRGGHHRGRRERARHRGRHHGVGPRPLRDRRARGRRRGAGAATVSLANNRPSEVEAWPTSPSRPWSARKCSPARPGSRAARRRRWC